MLKVTIAEITLVRWVFRFDTEQEMANLVACIDKDAPLRETLTKDMFYRLSLEHDGVFYCAIFHTESVGEGLRRSIASHATACGGKLLLDGTVMEYMSAYALRRWALRPDTPIRWDMPVPKPS